VDESIDEPSQKNRIYPNCWLYRCNQKGRRSTEYKSLYPRTRDFDLASLTLEGDRFAEGIKRSEKYAEAGDSDLFVPSCPITGAKQNLEYALTLQQGLESKSIALNIKNKNRQSGLFHQ
jgi:hypothetical protein